MEREIEKKEIVCLNSRVRGGAICTVVGWIEGRQIAVCVCVCVCVCARVRACMCVTTAYIHENVFSIIVCV